MRGMIFSEPEVGANIQWRSLVQGGTSEPQEPFAFAALARLQTKKAVAMANKEAMPADLGIAVAEFARREPAIEYGANRSRSPGRG